jgi:chromatin remodeling complex protein RSC6
MSSNKSPTTASASKKAPAAKTGTTKKQESSTKPAVENKKVEQKPEAAAGDGDGNVSAPAKIPEKVKAPAKGKGKAAAVAEPKPVEEQEQVKDVPASGPGEASGSGETSGFGEASSSDEVAVEEEQVKKKDDTLLVEKMLDELIKQVNANMARDREIVRKLQTFKKAQAKLVRDLKRGKRGSGRTAQKDGGSKKPSGFAQSSRVRDELCDFLGIDRGSRIARTEVTQKVIEYIKDKNLEKEDNHRNIEPDEILQRIVGTAAERRATMELRKKSKPNTKITDELGYFNLQIHLNKNFIKETPEEKKKYLEEQREREEFAQQATVASAA